MFENLALGTYDSLMKILPDLMNGIINGVVTLVFALIILFVGWLIALGIGHLITRILVAIKFNQYIEKAGIKDALEKAELKVDAAAFIGTIFKWIIFIAVLSLIAEILGLVKFAELLQSVLGYLPNVVIAVLVFVVAVIVAEILEKIVRTVVEGVKVGYGSLVGAIIKWSIWIFAILLILDQLGIGSELVRILFAGIVAMAAIAGGIAFGLGGRDVAAEILRDIKQKISS